MPTEGFRASLDGLIAKGVVGPGPVEPAKFGLLTRSLIGGIDADGRYFVGENADGRFTRWLVRDLEERKRRSGQE